MNFEETKKLYINFLKKNNLYHKKNFFLYENNIEKMANWTNSKFENNLKWYNKIRKKNKAKVYSIHLEKMKEWMSKLLAGSGDEVSSKRVIGVLGALVLFGTMIWNSFSPQDIAPSKELVEAVEYVTIAMFFGTAVEKFAKK